MKTTAALFFLLISFSISAQNIEVNGGVLENTFVLRDGLFGSTPGASDYGFAFNVGIDNIKFDWLPLGFYMGIEKYAGDIYAESVSINSSSHAEGSADKTVFSVSMYFTNFKLFKHLSIKLGPQFSWTINGSGNGIIDGYEGQTQIDEEESYRIEKSSWGISGRVAYDFFISDKIAISPQFGFYRGVSEELQTRSYEISSSRYYFLVGLRYKLGEIYQVVKSKRKSAQ